MNVIYEMRRKRLWTVELQSQCGGYKANIFLGRHRDHSPIPTCEVWSAGRSVVDALDEVAQYVDGIDGRPDNFATTPKRIKA